MCATCCQAMGGDFVACDVFLFTVKISALALSRVNRSHPGERVD